MRTGKLGVERAANLATFLPQGSAVYHATGSDMAWTEAEHELAHILDMLRGGQGDRYPRPSDRMRIIEKEDNTRRRAERFRERQLRRQAMRRSRSKANRR